MTQEEILKVIIENPGIAQFEITRKYNTDSSMVLALVRKKMVRREWMRGGKGGGHYRCWSML